MPKGTKSRTQLIDERLKLEDKSSASNVLTTSNGVKLRIKQVPPGVLLEVLHEINRDKPKPPKVYIQRLEKEMENPDDPEYIERLRDFRIEQAQALTEAMLMLGSELISCPKNIPKPEEETWATDFSGLIQIPSSGRARYAAWLKCVVLETDTDMMAVTSGIARKSGVAEEDVAAAAEGFRSPEGRNTT